MFDKLRNRTGKQVKKFQTPFEPLLPQDDTDLLKVASGYKAAYTGQNTSTFEGDLAKGAGLVSNTVIQSGKLSNFMGGLSKAMSWLDMEDPKRDQDLKGAIANIGKEAAQEGVKSALGGMAGGAGGMLGGAPWGAIGTAANAAVDMLDNALMGDKQFDTQSQAIDDAVRMASQKLSQTGPWGLLAAGVIETMNLADKAAGKSVQGFEVGDAGSGFQGIDLEQDTFSYRGSQTGKMKRNLARRNQQMNMAMMANQVSEDEKFQMNARMSSISNTIEANQIALAGGIDTSLLGG